MEKFIIVFTQGNGDYQLNDNVIATTEKDAIIEFICRLAKHYSIFLNRRDYWKA